MAQHIRIISKVDGFRRCGIAHSEEAKFYQLSRFSPEELKRLKAERMLVVDEMDPPAPAAPEKKAGAKT
jgi:hypothetical protein